MAEQITEAAPQVEVSFSEQQLSQRVKEHDLPLTKLLNNLRINDQLRIDVLQRYPQSTEKLQALDQAIQDYPHRGDLTTFTHYINHLIFLWLSAVDSGVDPAVVMRLLQCFKINGLMGRLSTNKLHLFLQRLFSESTHHYQQVIMDYALNFDRHLQLPNVNKLMPEIEQAIESAHEQDITALLSIHFRTENNNFLLPREVSLKLNKRLAEILSSQVSKNGAQIYFIGDYQFDILISSIKSTTQLELLAAKIFRAFEDVIFISNQSILLRPFIGYAYAKGQKTIGDELFHNAKLALEYGIAKENFHVVYSDALEERISERIILESKILEAFDNHNLMLGFQPIIDLQSNECVGAELLLRSQTPDGQNIPPELAIEVLNNVGKGKIFTRWLINSAFRQSHELTHKHGLHLYLTINLRAEDLYDNELPDLFANALSLWQVSPNDIVLEITEKGILEANEHTNAIINALADIGFKFALDDFGTGFSSLSRLKTMPIDYIKIDQSFIRNITDSKDDYNIVESIAALSKSLDKQVIAEGVEDESGLALVKSLAIDKCQGYHFSKSLPFDAFIDWVKSHNR